MKFLFITTTVWSDKSLTLLERLSDSIKAHSQLEIPCQHIILLQNWSTNQSLPKLSLHQQHEIEYLTTPETISLSAARNQMLEYVFLKDLLKPQDILAYPDDDCWYPHQILNKIAQLFLKKPELEFFFCKYHNDDFEKIKSIENAKQATCKDLVRNASSNTLFLKGSLGLKIDGFDRQLGLGAKHKGGEDLDYGILAFLNTKHCYYAPAYLIGHRNKDASLRGQYYRGSALTLNRYKMKSLSFFYEYIRKLMIGVILVFQKEMDIKELYLATQFIKSDSKIAKQKP